MCVCMYGYIDEGAPKESEKGIESSKAEDASNTELKNLDAGN